MPVGDPPPSPAPIITRVGEVHFGFKVKTCTHLCETVEEFLRLVDDYETNGQWSVRQVTVIQIAGQFEPDRIVVVFERLETES